MCGASLRIGASGRKMGLKVGRTIGIGATKDVPVEISGATGRGLVWATSWGADLFRGPIRGRWEVYMSRRPSGGIA